jgi:CTD kinase subunit gamma
MKFKLVALHNPVSLQPPQLACFYSLTELGGRQEELALDIKFENEWDDTSKWNKDDEDGVKEAEVSLLLTESSEIYT